jgi:hypothetical protein
MEFGLAPNAAEMDFSDQASRIARAGDLVLQQAVPILREDRGIPNRMIPGCQPRLTAITSAENRAHCQRPKR